MRHYFGYDIDGVLSTLETYGPIGWPAEHCMEDPECLAASVVSLRESRAKSAPGVIDWIVFDCPCDPGQGAILTDCVCVSAKFAKSYVNVATKTMLTKPSRQVFIDDILIATGDVVTKTPGSLVTLKIVGSQIPDGEVVTINQAGAVDLALEDEWDLTFENGTVADSTLIAPAQGSKGVFSISGRLIQPLVACIRGFATPA